MKISWFWVIFWIGMFSWVMYTALFMWDREQIAQSFVSDNRSINITTVKDFMGLTHLETVVDGVKYNVWLKSK
jgi:hypothetical protein